MLKFKHCRALMYERDEKREDKRRCLITSRGGRSHVHNRTVRMGRRGEGVKGGQQRRTGLRKGVTTDGRKRESVQRF